MAKPLRILHDKLFEALLQMPLPIVVKVQPGLAGFFGKVFLTINGLRIAQKYGKRAVVHWGAGSPYFEAARGPNAFAYFFRNDKFDFSEGRHEVAFTVPYRPGADDFFVYDGVSPRRSVSQALHAWCQPRCEISTAVAAFHLEQFGSRPMLGLHIRLTDVAMGAEGRRTVGMDQIVGSVDAWLERQQDGGIFLATDDDCAITFFKKRYGCRVVFQNCLRSQDGTSIHGHYDAGIDGSPYQKGYEVLVDALLLARCNHLIRTHSRVTAFSLCWNPSLSYIDLEREILGIDRTPWLHA